MNVCSDIKNKNAKRPNFHKGSQSHSPSQTNGSTKIQINSVIAIPKLQELAQKMRVCHKSVTHPFFVFFLFTDTKSLKNIFIYNKAQTFTSSGFAFPQKICIFAENFLKYGKDTNKI
ncbi:MAG TPA: hypothetical protein DEQ66_06340 [Prevotella sp.]|nr:hypothetical protein [Prevotella sp.]